MHDATMPTGTSELPPALRRYIVFICVSGPLVALGLALANPFQLSGEGMGRVALLLAFAIAAEYYTFQLTHKTSVNVASACYFAMILVFPLGLVGLLAYGSGAVGQFLRRRGDSIEALFNAGQGALYVSFGALAFALIRDLPYLGPHLEAFAPIGAIAILAVILHAANTGLVAGAAGLQLGTSPVKVWLRDFPEDVAAHAAMMLLGMVIAVLLLDHVWLLPALALPLILIHQAIGKNVRLRADTHQALASLVEIVELCDPYTAGHSRRVATHARQIAIGLGLTHEEADEVETAGRVHDVGKIAIDRTVLTKSGKLTKEEFAEVQRHVVLGANVIAQFEAYGEGHKLVRHHHERWDGQGYPDGLAGECIPLGARILSVADAYDAMTSERAYRGAMKPEQVRAILAKGAGTQWDPRVVSVFLNLPSQTEEHAAPSDFVPNVARDLV